MDKLASVLKLAKEIVALLEAPTAIKKPTPHIIAASATAAVAKKTQAAKPAKPVKQKSNAVASAKKEHEGTLNTLPKEKQAYLLKKVKEAKAFFKREYPSITQHDVNRYVEEVSKECVRFGHVTHPRKFTVKEWKEYTDEQFQNAFYDKSDDEGSDDESSDDE